MQQSRRKSRAEMGAQIGSASIVMIFAVLCLTIFAALAFETAGYEQRLAEKSASAVEAYYIADGIAEERYLQIYQLLQSDKTAVQLHAELEQLGVVVKLEEPQMTLRYAVPIDDMQELQVELLWQENHLLQIERWNTATVAQWDYEDTIQVWDGTSEQQSE